jgi:putative DNA primase/helicase
VYNEDEIEKDIANEIGEFIPSHLIKRVKNIMDIIKRECIFNHTLTEDEKIELYSTKSNRAIRFNKESKKYEVFEVTDEIPRVNTINVNFTEDLLSNRGITYEELQKLAPFFHKWITDLMDTKERDILQEFLGYCMTASTKCQMALQIEGDAGLGKSRIYDILSLLVGRSKISSYDLTALETEQYLLPVISNKLVIYDDDIKVQSLKDTGLLKTLITSNNEPIKARQIYGAYHDVPVYAKIVACGNHILSSLYDRSDGLWRRFILLSCKPLDNNRENITYDIFLQNFQKELPYIFIWCLDGLERLINNEWKFSHQDLITSQRELLKANSDSVFAFFSSCREIEITHSRTDIITKKDLYALYCDYCDLYDLHPLAIKSFSKEVNAKASKYGIQNDVVKINRKSERAFRGIAIVENAYEEIAEEELQTVNRPTRNNIIKFSS